MTRRLVAMTAAVALLAFSAVPSFADHHGGGPGGGSGGWHVALWFPPDRFHNLPGLKIAK
jgi:hypothetical protein